MNCAQMSFNGNGNWFIDYQENFSVLSIKIGMTIAPIPNLQASEIEDSFLENIV